MKTSEDVVSSWLFALAGSEPKSIMAGAMALIRQGLPAGKIYPTPDMILAFVKDTTGESEAAEKAWAKGPSGAHTETEKSAWRSWGGAVRYGALPDPKYAEDPVKAQNVLSFARKEFLDAFRAYERATTASDILATLMEIPDAKKLLTGIIN